jgi:hypothetical protein
MYDYISIYSDSYYSGYIEASRLEKFAVDALLFKKESHLKFGKMLHGKLIRLIGIAAASNGSYAFDSLDGIEQINLIEINLPMQLNPALEEELEAMASAIANEFSWIIENK